MFTARMLRFLILFTQHAHEYLPKSILAMTRSRSVSSPSSMFKAPRMVRQDCAICNMSLQATMTAATSRGSNGMLKSFSRQEREQASEIVVFFAIGAVGEFEHSPPSRSQPLGITSICQTHFELTICHH